MRAATAKLERTTLRTSRLLDFCSRKELIAQTGHQPDAWPLVVLKELVDNALDAYEEADEAGELGESTEVPEGLRAKVKRHLDEDSAATWDEIIRDLAVQGIDDDDVGDDE